MQLLPPSFFERPAPAVARALVGARLVHEHPADGTLVGRIVETEAYPQGDPAWRSWGIVDAATGLVMPEGRGLDLFGRPGTAYLYLCYGRYWMLNVVTEPEGRAGCVLVRAAEPLAGRPAMWKRRGAARRDADLANGPGKLCQAFDLDGRFHRHPLTAPPLFLAAPDAGRPLPVAVSARIGLRFGIDLPYRFFVPGHPCVSPAQPAVEAARARHSRRPRLR